MVCNDGEAWLCFIEPFQMKTVLLLLLGAQAGSGPDALVEQQVGAGGERLLQAGLAHRVVRHPQPLGVERGGAAGRGGAAAVRDEVARVHVAVMHQHSRQPEQVLRRTAGTGGSV